MAGLIDRAAHAASEALALAALVERLRWPVPMVRWRAARGLRDLLAEPATRAEATAAILGELQGCTTEARTCDLLSILWLSPFEARPDQAAVIASIKAPSILANLLLARTYGAGAGVSWTDAHSGEVPAVYSPEPYFKANKQSHAPPMFSMTLSRLEAESGRPFTRQWAYEWDRLAVREGVPYTLYPYYFDDFGEVRLGLIGSYLQGQSDIFRSAYLRTLALAESLWDMPYARAEAYCSELLPTIGGLFDLDPAPRPDWLADRPERCANDPSEIVAHARAIMAAAGQNGRRLVALEAPIAIDVARYGVLSLKAFLASPDFSADDGLQASNAAHMILDGHLYLEGTQTTSDPGDFVQTGSAGMAYPVCPRLMPLPFGHWHGDYHAAGMPVPASYIVGSGATLRCADDAIRLERNGLTIATTGYWLDRWSPRFPRGGATRCGVAAHLDDALLVDLLAANDARLYWIAELKIWREGDHEPYRLETRRAGFFDIAFAR